MIINHNMSAMYANRALGSHADRAQQEHGEARFRAADQPRRRRCFRPRGFREAAQPDPRPQPGTSGTSRTAYPSSRPPRATSRRRRTYCTASASCPCSLSNGIYTAEDRMQIQVEVSQLVDEINRIASHAQFNGMNILTGRFRQHGDQIMQLQVGANMDQNERIFIGTMTAEALGLQGAQGATDGTDFHRGSRKGQPVHRHARRRPQDRIKAARRPRRLPEPLRDGLQGRRDRSREPPGRREPHPRHRHGQRDGRVTSRTRSCRRPAERCSPRPTPGPSRSCSCWVNVNRSMIRHGELPGRRLSERMAFPGREGIAPPSPCLLFQGGSVCQSTFPPYRRLNPYFPSRSSRPRKRQRPKRRGSPRGHHEDRTTRLHGQRCSEELSQRKRRLQQAALVQPSTRSSTRWSSRSSTPRPIRLYGRSRPPRSSTSTSASAR